jgi:hypothetical protein
MTAGSDDFPHAEPTVVRGRVNVAPSDPVPPGAWPPGHPDQQARPARPVGRTWWVLPYCAGALAVFLVSGLIIGLRYNSGPAQPGALSTAEPMPAQMFPDALFGELSADLQAGNETAFLGLASASARPAITSWWDNLEAIGFTTGAVLPTAPLDAVSIDSHGNGSTVVLAGAHSPLDPASDLGKPQIPMVRYQIGLHFASPGAIGQITSWRPLDDAPWDSGSPLYVRKAAYVVVAGPPADRALIDQTLPVAETAAAYDMKMMGYVASDFLQQHGFVVFVSGSATVSNAWFATDPQPSGWPPQFLGARAVQLPGPGVSEYTPIRTGTTSLVNTISNNNMGGVRVVLTPSAAGTAQDETDTLVRDFMLDIQASHDEELANGIPLKPVPSWTEEGLAVAAQSLFEANPDPVPAKGNYDWATLTAGLRALPRSYRSGVYPSTQQLFGPSLTADEAWGDVAASTYEYIDSRYNITKMMVSGMEIYVGHPTPFANVYKSGTNANNLVFFGIHSIRLGWQPWLARL